MDKFNNEPGKKMITFWKSTKDKENHPDILQAKKSEFLPGVDEPIDIDAKSGLSRRKFLAISAAGAAFATVACTDYRDKGAIIAYNKKPDNIMPGKANYYASTCTACSLSCGILIKTREGRPIKVDGNPEHPVNKGKICAAGHANILNLYAPDRIKEPMKKRGGDLFLFKDDLVKMPWKDIDKEIVEHLNNAVKAGKEIAIIARPNTSLTANQLMSDFIKKYPTTKVYYHSVFEGNRKNAWGDCYPHLKLPVINWDEANIILSLEGDFLGNEGNFVENIRKFAEKRNVNKLDDFNRLYVAESKMSLTGMNADYRLRLTPDSQYEFIMSLANEIIIKKKGIANIFDDIYISKIKNYSLEKFALDNKLSKITLDNLVSDLIKNQGKSMIYAGDILPLEIHYTVNQLNEVLGNWKLYDEYISEISNSDNPKKTDFEALVSKMYSKNIGVLINFNSNPVFELPTDYGYEEALKNVPVIISLTEMANESSNKANYILPINHNFESWGDHYTRTGVYSLQQPVINPLYYTRQKEAVLLNWCSDKPENFYDSIYHDYLMNYWEKNIHNPDKNYSAPTSDFKTFWFASLHDGVYIRKEDGQVYLPIVFKEIDSGFNEKVKKPRSNSGFTLLLSNNYTIFADGRFANNGWLQELPHPVTKITWDNYAAISPATAKELGVKFEDMIEIKVGNKSVKLPVVLQPGMADKVVAVELGYGRKTAGDVGNDVGTDVNFLLSKNPDFSQWIFTGVQVAKADGKHKLATTQEHHMLDETRIKDIHKTRNIIQEGTVDEYKKNPEFLKEEHEEAKLISVNPVKEYKDVKWAMSIDLNKCVGCGACSTACSVENNVPFIGKEEVTKGREMHWIRIDRYYSGTDEEPEVSNQPMLCQHCDNAPCENVCPVAATNHSPDGLNQMVYNRCVGTRYCANNCPFKVRRFNFFDNRERFADSYQKKDSFQLIANPEVTVRSRGVMEKCTFCIQRIMDARQEAIKDGRKLKGTDVKTACQVACPAEAIVFGDSNDHESEIAKLREHKLGYHVLEELNVKPNVTYIARLRNKRTEDK